MQDILRITQQPGLSVGVLHQGEEVLKHNFGVRDIVTGQKVDSDTLFCIASLTKAFIAASLDKLIHEEKLSWDSTIQSIIPEFKHNRKTAIFADMNLRDIFSHHTGLLSLDEIIQGMDGRILVPKSALVEVCNALPIKYGFRSNYLYNNALYELAGHVIERTSGYSNWGRYLHDQVFAPLMMNRTTSFREVHTTDQNIATPYMILTNGTPSRISPTELSADSMNGGSGGVRSSVSDLLKSFGAEASEDSFVQPDSSIFHRTTIANPRYAEEGDYCAGWCYHRTPAKFGLISPNRAWESPLVGAASPSLLVYGHQGDVPGYTCNIYIVPSSHSAIVILSNGTGLSDATDWIAQDLLQAMHKLQPSIDFVDVALRSANKYLSHYTKGYKVRVTATARGHLKRD